MLNRRCGRLPLGHRPGVGYNRVMRVKWLLVSVTICLVAALTAPPGSVHAQQPTPEPPTETPPADPPPEETPPRVVPPRLTHFEPASLPPDAWTAAPEDVDEVSVVLVLTIGTDGIVSEVTLRTGTGEPFDGAALAAAALFRFESARVDGQPVAVQVPYTYVFQIERPKPVEPEPEPDPDPEPAASGSVAGRILERGTRKPIAGVLVVLEVPGQAAGPTHEAITDAEGSYQLDAVPDGSYLLRISVMQGREERANVTVADGAATEVDTIYSRPGRFSKYRTVLRDKTPKTSASEIRLSEGEIKTVPGTFGEPTRVVATLPGVARSPFGLGYYVIRGADFQNTGVLIDDFTTLLLYHFLGGPAVIHPEFIESVEFHPGGYPVEYGRYTAGLINVRSKPTPRDRWHLIVDVDLLKAGAFFSVPFADGKGAIAMAARTSYLELVLPLVAPDQDINLHYWDYQFRFSYEFSPSTTLELFFMGSGDTLSSGTADESESFEDEGASTTFGMMFHRVQAHFIHRFSRLSSLRSDTLVAYNNTDVSQQSPGNPFYRVLTNAVLVGERVTFDHRFDDNWRLVTGLDFNAWTLTAKVSVPQRQPIGEVPKPAFDPLLFSGEISETEIDLAGFVSVDWEPIDGLRVVPGLRIDWFDYNGHHNVAVDPRLMVRWQATDWLTLKGGTGLYHQAPELQVIDETYGNPELPPSASVQTSFGAEFAFLEDWEISVTGFYNHMFDMAEPTNAIASGGADGEVARANFAANGVGRAYGAELLVRKRFGEWVHGWLTYTISRSERRVGDDRWELFLFDQTHVLNLAWTFLLPDDWSIGARFRLTSGNTTDRVVGAVYDADKDSYDPIYHGKERLPLFHQLDLRVDKRFLFETWILEIYLDIQNVYYARNAEFYRYKYDYSERDVIEGLPILPTLGFRLVF